MTRNFGMGDGRPTAGAFRQPSVSIGNYQPSNSILFSEPALKRGEIAQALIDVSAVLSGLLWVVVFSLAVAASLLILLFVRMP